MTAVILINCIELAVNDPTQPSANPLETGIETAFLAIYTIEMLLKMIALGLIYYKSSYFRDLWNVLDFFIVAANFASLFGVSISSSNVKKPIYFSSLKIISPLRTINVFPKLKLLIRTIIDSIPSLAEILIVIAVVFGIFGVIGVQLFQGRLRLKCFEAATGRVPDLFDESLMCGGIKSCPEGFICGSTGGQPVAGIFSFDNILEAYLLVFIVTTQEGWTVIQSYII